MQHSKIRSRLKAQLTKFTSQLTVGLSKPLRDFAGEMLFGIQASQDIKLSSVARSYWVLDISGTEADRCEHLSPGSHKSLAW